MKKVRIVGILLIICLSMAYLGGCFILGNCSLFSGISFTENSLTIGVGRTVDLDEYIEISNSLDDGYTLTSDNDNIVQVISVTSVKAVSKGSAKIKAELNSSAKSAEIEIIVDFDRPQSMILRTTGELFQNEESASSVTFIATVDLGADPDLNFEWSVNGEPQDNLGFKQDKKSFTLDKMTAGEYVVRAVCLDGEVEAEKTVRVYKNLETPILCYQEETVFDEIPSINPIITIDVQNDIYNPDLFVEWFVDDILVKSEFNNFPFLELNTDRIGKHKIYALINGQRICTQENQDFIEIIYKGAVTPNIKFEYLNYPTVKLSWTNHEETMFKVSVKRKSDSVVILNKNVEATKGGCDLFDIIDLSKDYTLRVESLDSADGIFFGGNYAEEEYFAVPQNALTYLKKGFLGKNYYMTCDDDLYAVFEYLIIFRPDTILNGTGDSSMTVYMGYNSKLTASDLSNSFKERLNMTGAYKWSVSGNLKTGNFVTIKITFYYYNAPLPYNFTTEGKEFQNVYIAPGTSKIGLGEDYALPIDNYPLSMSTAETSDQLFISVQKWLRPNCAANSAASRIYNKARSVLSQIIDEDMDEADKAAAIYDWVMFAVSYDYDVVEIDDTSLAVKQPAFYLEGVFDTGFAVCDGISKAYSLLCNMAGIECLRVVGSAKSGTVWGEHAWNKVLLDGGWYIVDATWGIARITGTSFKFGTKAWFLLNDSDVAGSRIEKGGVYPPTSLENYNYHYKKGYYVFDNGNLFAIMQNVANQLIQLRNDKAFTVCGTEYYSYYYAIEFEVSPALISEFKKMVNNPLGRYLTGYYHNIHADASRLNNMIVVAIE